MAIVAVSSADELRSNNEFQEALGKVWPSMRVYLDDELRTIAADRSIDAAELGHRTKAHFFMVANIERLIGERLQQEPQVRYPKLHNVHHQ